EERGVVHQQLPVCAEYVDQADIAARQRPTLLSGQLILIKQSLQILAILSLGGRIAVEVVQELLQLIEAHGDVARRRGCTIQAPQRGMWCERRLTQTFLGSRNTS